MNNKIASLTASLSNVYPIFEPNQLLTSNHLNELRNYLDTQDRLSRVKLIGIGVVCGLELSYSSKGITISKGTGITSDGFLIHLPETTYPKCAAANYTHPENYELLEDPTVPDTGKITAWQLLEKESAVSPVIEFNKSEFVNFVDNKVVMLLLEHKDIDLESCVGQNCDDKGITREFNVRPLLVDCSNAEKIIRKGYKTGDKLALNDVFNKRFQPQLIQMRAFTMTSLKVGVEEQLEAYNAFSEEDTIYRRYQTLFENEDLNLIDIFKQAMEVAYKTYYPILPAFAEKEIVSIAELLGEQWKKVSDHSTIQYFYDYMKDLYRAYNEFVTEAFEIVSSCCPGEHFFPRHLMLGKVRLIGGCPENTCMPPIYRTGFLQSPIYNNQKDKLAEVQFLFNRIIIMMKTFTPDVLEYKVLRITPSNETIAKLEKRAIPFYYKDKSIFENWNYQLSKRRMNNRVLGYHTRELEGIPETVRYPLFFDTDEYNFYRIEGLLNMPVKKAKIRLDYLRRKHHLDFSIKALTLKRESKIEDASDCGSMDLKEAYLQLRNKIIIDLTQADHQFTNLSGILLKLKSLFFNDDEDPKPDGEDPGSGDGKDVSAFDAVDVMDKMEDDWSKKALTEEELKKLEEARDFAEKEVVEAEESKEELGETEAEGRRRVEVVDMEEEEYATKVSETPDKTDFDDDLPVRPIRKSIYQLLMSKLPKCLDDFSFEEFENFYRILKKITFYQVLETEKVIRQLKVYGLFYNTVFRTISLSKGILMSYHNSFEIFNEHFDVQLYSLYISKKGRKKYTGDENWFSKFAWENPGLKHMAGVPKGGTFILLQNESGDDGKIIGDFAVESKECQTTVCTDVFLPCEMPIIYPPFAPDIYRVVDMYSGKGEVRGEGEAYGYGEPVIIDVVSYAIDLNVKDLVIADGFASYSSIGGGLVEYNFNPLLGRYVISYRFSKDPQYQTDQIPFTINHADNPEISASAIIYLTKITPFNGLDTIKDKLINPDIVIDDDPIDDGGDDSIDPVDDDPVDDGGDDSIDDGPVDDSTDPVDDDPVVVIDDSVDPVDDGDPSDEDVFVEDDGKPDLEEDDGKGEEVDPDLVNKVLQGLAKTLGLPLTEKGQINYAKLTIEDIENIKKQAINDVGDESVRNKIIEILDEEIRKKSELEG